MISMASSTVKSNDGIEKRSMRMIVSQGGGPPGKKKTIYKLSIPIPWARALNITKEDPEVVMCFDGDKIVIHRPV